jgi:hypothetical protein
MLEFPVLNVHLNVLQLLDAHIMHGLNIFVLKSNKSKLFKIICKFHVIASVLKNNCTFRTTYNGGTCWMKTGAVSKSDAFSTTDQTMVCGLL